MRTESSFLSALKMLSPMIIGMLPFAIAFGIFCVAAGVPGNYAILMSATVYAGLAQFVAVDMYAHGLDNFAILIGFVLLVNLRFTLMGLSLKSHSPTRARWKDCLLSFGLSDEPYVVAVNQFSTHGYCLSFHIWAYLLVYIFWVFGTAIGVYASSLISNPHSYGLEFALCAAFLVMLIPRVKQWDEFAAALLSGFLAIIFYSAGVGEASIILASMFSISGVAIIKKNVAATDRRYE
ncbi:AzlC family ABC transporter permease [Sedimenticola sp.]|uniref:AzlC family ABC transporter permease n=1 Tax=Sedimenticola sp. TaxID=1940285 RepID=UPI003D0A74A6